jgi:hypothetical protein
MSESSPKKTKTAVTVYVCQISSVADVACVLGDPDACTGDLEDLEDTDMFQYNKIYQGNFWLFESSATMVDICVALSRHPNTEIMIKTLTSAMTKHPNRMANVKTAKDALGIPEVAEKVVKMHNTSVESFVSSRDIDDNPVNFLIGC